MTENLTFVILNIYMQSFKVDFPVYINVGINGLNCLKYISDHI